MPQLGPRETIRDVINGVALTSLLFAISAVLPLVGFVCTPLIPLPILFYRSKLGRQKGLITAASAVVLMMIVFGRVSVDILLFSELLLLGFALAELLELDLTVEKTVAYACTAVLVTGFMAVMFFGSLSGTSAYAVISAYVARNLELSLLLYEQMGMATEFIEVFARNLDVIQYYIIRLIPGLLVAVLLVLSWVSLLLAGPLFKRKGLFFPDYGPLVRWKAPEMLIWGAIGCGVAVLLPSRFLTLVGYNGLAILMTIFFFEGIAIVAFYFDKKKLPRFVRVFLYSMIALQQVMLLLVIGLGFFDMWINFRKLNNDNAK